MLKIIPQPTQITYLDGSVGEKLFTVTDDSIAKEGYELHLTEKGITIFSSDKEGLFYARKTLEQIMRQCDVLPSVIIKDAPLFAYRGYMLDCSRHFFTVEEILKQIDILSSLKINKFHWHLSDDQGWRIQIDKYPLLTQIGSKRKQTRNDNKPVEGFYTKTDIIKVIKYCEKHCIEVIPEFDIPGHFTAAIASYPHLGCKYNEIEVSEHFGIHADIACVGKQSTYEFCKNVLTEILEIFPGKYMHLGGDEALKLHWFECENCQNAIKQKNLKNEEELQGAFLSEMIAYVNSYGKTAILWNDGLLGGNISGDYIIQHWKEGKKYEDLTNSYAENGKRVVYSPFFSFYLDYPCGMTPIKKTYNFDLKVKEDAIMGLEAPLWTEYVESVAQLEYMTYPRIIAVAERAWSQQFDYNSFMARLKDFVGYLKTQDININKDCNPHLIKKITQIAKFGINAWDKSLLTYTKQQKKSKKIWRKKYK